MGAGASRLVGGGGASLADGGAAGASNADAASDGMKIDNANDEAGASPSPAGPLSEEDRASAAAAAAVASAFGLENFGNTCYCNSVLQVKTKKRTMIDA